VSSLVDGYYGDGQDCRLYHVCIDGRDYRSMCSPGLAWESLLRLCMPAHLVHCSNSKSFDLSTGMTRLVRFMHTIVRATFNFMIHRIIKKQMV
jgi:hypothetical protein